MKTFRVICALVLSSILGASFAQAQIIAVNFNNTYASSPENITATTGAIAVDLTDWNNAAAPQGGTDSGPFIDSTGATVGGGFSFYTAYAGNYETTNTGLGNLLNGYGDHFNTLTISNIPYATYNLYVYVASDGNGRDASGTVGSTTLTFSTAAADATSFTVNSTPDTDYSPYNTLLFQNLTSADVTYTQAYVYQAVGVAGFEIVSVPEPSTWAMLIGGALALVGAARLRRQLL
jgi:hypothetical protein